MGNQFSIKNGINKQGIYHLDDTTCPDGTSFKAATDYVYEPALAGLIHIYIENIPRNILNAVSLEVGKQQLTVEKGFWFLAKSGTFPVSTLQDQNYDGMIVIPTPGKLETEHQATISFLDTRELIATKLLRGLFNTIRPHPQALSLTYPGLHSSIVSMSGGDTVNAQYGVNILVFTTDETFQNVTYSKLLVGCYPRTLPSDILHADYTDVLVYRFSQSFVVSYSVSDDVTDKLAEVALKTKLNQFITLYT